MNDRSYLETWNTYQKAWGPVSEDERRDLLAASVADEIVYSDPTSQVEGIAPLAERIAAGQRKTPGASFRNDAFLEHHGQALFSWTMLKPDGSVFVKGESFGRFRADGRLVQATGFFETPQA